MQWQLGRESRLILQSPLHSHSTAGMRSMLAVVYQASAASIAVDGAAGQCTA